jgi:hypothetical protein
VVYGVRRTVVVVVMDTCIYTSISLERKNDCIYAVLDFYRFNIATSIFSRH